MGTFLKRRATVQTELNVLCSALRIWMTKNHINHKIRSGSGPDEPTEDAGTVTRVAWEAQCETSRFLPTI